MRDAAQRDREATYVERSESLQVCSFLILLDISDRITSWVVLQMSEKSSNYGLFSGSSQNRITHKCKAKYYPQPDGSFKLGSIEEFSIPLFRERGYEPRRELPAGYMFHLSEVEAARSRGDAHAYEYHIKMLQMYEREYFDEGDVLTRPCTDDTGGDSPRALAAADRAETRARAIRRAKKTAFDYIVCNYDLDVFCTLTFDPKIVNSCSYTEVYERVRGWLANRVQRKGLKYVIIPEYHKDGEKIHFHAVMNSAALDLIEARYDNGRLIKKRVAGQSKQLYNIADWSFGFTSAEFISGDDAHVKISKYVFKYMGKSMETRIGGRYYLHGGKLRVPRLIYGNSADEFSEFGKAKYTKRVEVADGIVYTEYTFL